jgi:chloramphenicol O-acetyltransferase
MSMEEFEMRDRKEESFVFEWQHIFIHMFETGTSNYGLTVVDIAKEQSNYEKFEHLLKV